MSRRSFDLSSNEMITRDTLTAKCLINFDRHSNLIFENLEESLLQKYRLGVPFGFYYYWFSIFLTCVAAVFHPVYGGRESNSPPHDRESSA